MNHSAGSVSISHILDGDLLHTYFYLTEEEQKQVAELASERVETKIRPKDLMDVLRHYALDESDASYL